MNENFYVLMQLWMTLTATIGEWKRLLNVFKYKDIYMIGDGRFVSPEVFRKELKQSEELDKLKSRIEDAVGKWSDPDGSCRIDMTVGEGMALITLIKISGDRRLSAMYRELMAGMVFSTTKACSRAIFLFQEHVGVKDLNRRCNGFVRTHAEEILAWTGITPDILDVGRIKKVSERGKRVHEDWQTYFKKQKEALRQKTRRPADDSV